MPTAPGPSVSLLMITTSACGLPRKSRRCIDTFSGVLGPGISCLLDGGERVTTACPDACPWSSGDTSHQRYESALAIQAERERRLGGGFWQLVLIGEPPDRRAGG